MEGSSLSMKWLYGRFIIVHEVVVWTVHNCPWSGCMEGSSLSHEVVVWTVHHCPWSGCMEGSSLSMKCCMDGSSLSMKWLYGRSSLSMKWLYGRFIIVHEVVVWTVHHCPWSGCIEYEVISTININVGIFFQCTINICLSHFHFLWCWK